VLDTAAEALVRSRIKIVADWPQVGVSFKDLSGVMADPLAFRAVIDGLAGFAAGAKIDAVIGIEARGFPYGAALAHHLGAGFVAMRKAGKLPGEVHAREYELEYGTATLELHTDAVGAGQRVLIIDDVLATGGTAAAAIDLVRKTGADIAAVLVIMDLPFLGGRALLESRAVPVHTLLSA
jgi:adenine phosphoribosyltransferase